LAKGWQPGAVDLHFSWRGATGDQPRRSIRAFEMSDDDRPPPIEPKLPISPPAATLKLNSTTPISPDLCYPDNIRAANEGARRTIA